MELLDFVGDVGDDLDRAPQVVAPALLGDDVEIDAPGGEVVLLAQGDGGVAFVMAQVQVGFGAVFGDEHLAVLEGVHGAGVHVDVRVQLLEGDPEAPGLQQRPDGRGRHPFAQGGQHPAGNKDDFRFHKSLNIPARLQCQAGGRAANGTGPKRIGGSRRASASSPFRQKLRCFFLPPSPLITLSRRKKVSTTRFWAAGGG